MRFPQLAFILIALIHPCSSIGQDESEWISSPDEKRVRDTVWRMTSGHFGNTHINFTNTGPYLKTIEVHQNMGSKIPKVSGPFPMSIPNRGRLSLVGCTLVPTNTVAGKLEYKHPQTGEVVVPKMLEELPLPKLDKRRKQIRLLFHKDFKEFNIRRISVFDAATHVEISKSRNEYFADEYFALDVSILVSHPTKLRCMIDLVKRGEKHEEEMRLWFEISEHLLASENNGGRPENLFDLPITHFTSSYASNVRSIFRAVSDMTQMQVNWSRYSPEKMLAVVPKWPESDESPTARDLLREFQRCASEYGVKVDQSTHTIYVFDKSAPNDEVEIRNELLNAAKGWEEKGGEEKQ